MNNKENKPLVMAAQVIISIVGVYAVTVILFLI